MALTLSEDAKNEFLEEIGHDYVSKIWATVVICTSKILNYATKSKQKRIQQLNTYAYVGLTKDRLNIVTLSSLNITSPTGYFSIPRSDLEKLSIKKKSFKYVMTFQLQGELVQINLPLTAIGINIKNQIRNVQALTKDLED